MPSIGDLSDILHPFDAAADYAKSKTESPATPGTAPTTDPNPSRGTTLSPTGKLVLAGLGLLAVLYIGKKVVDRTLAPPAPRFGRNEP